MAPSLEVLEERIKAIDKHLERDAEKAHESRKVVYEKLDKIYAQTIRTNGRVSSLEKWRDEHKDKHDDIDERAGESRFSAGRASVYFWIIGLVVAAVVGAAFKSIF